ncbi:MAG: hypothetical protein EZS28_018516 [Streblomastix strix]|uniref:Uncharacterized protein n=1 Tax=Streblomastix strix TaxID=222440 RepID=A0A5J4VU42_9EUKA|nr:MAG: hypothetical protein EZS28_018516 [Streblomastix strix]
MAYGVQIEALIGLFSSILAFHQHISCIMLQFRYRYSPPLMIYSLRKFKEPMKLASSVILTQVFLQTMLLHLMHFINIYDLLSTIIYI